MYLIIKKPIISEKSMLLAKSGLYTFVVSEKARKIEIAQAIENKFGVNVVSVKTVNLKQEKRPQRTRRGTITIPGYKKALVGLKSGQKIAIFEPAKEDTKAEEEQEVKEKKSLLKGTKVKIERSADKKVAQETKEEK